MTIVLYCNVCAANKIEAGGLSGAPLKPYSLKAVRTLRALLPASIPLIGCGGIMTGADALEYAKAGASMVQVYTGFGYDGVGHCRRVKDQLIQALAKEGTTWEQVVAESVSKLSLDEGVARVGEKAVNAVGRLIIEAQELKELVDKLGEKIDREQFYSGNAPIDNQAITM